MRRIKTVRSPDANDFQYVVLGNGPHRTITERDYRLMLAVVSAVEKWLQVSDYTYDHVLEDHFHNFNAPKRSKP